MRLRHALRPMKSLASWQGCIPLPMTLALPACPITPDQCSGSAWQDTYVANGVNLKTNYGYATTLNVATSPVDQDLSSIAMLKFDLTQARARLLMPADAVLARRAVQKPRIARHGQRHLPAW